MHIGQAEAAALVEIGVHGQCPAVAANFLKVICRPLSPFPYPKSGNSLSGFVAEAAHTRFLDFRSAGWYESV
jgi:hypothetical protein